MLRKQLGLEGRKSAVAFAQETGVDGREGMVLEQGQWRACWLGLILLWVSVREVDPCQCRASEKGKPEAF